MTASLNIFVLTSSVRSDCNSFGVIDDNNTESIENFTITLEQGSSEVEFINDTATILVIDNDGKTSICVEYRNIPLKLTRHYVKACV